MSNIPPSHQNNTEQADPFWRIQKEWVQDWGLSPAESLVLADIIDWPQCSHQERARRVNLSTRQLTRIKDILSSRKETKYLLPEDKMSSIRRQNVSKKETKCPQTEDKMSPKGQNVSNPTRQNVSKMETKCPQNGDKMSFPPYNPPYIGEQGEQGERGNARTREAPQVIDQEKKIYGLVLARWNAHYRHHYSTDYIPDYRSLTNDAATIAEAVSKKMPDFGRDPTDDADARQFLDDMFESMRTAADAWQRQHWSLHTIATQFNELYQKITNANNNDNQRPDGSGISRDYLERKMREAVGAL